MLPGRCRSIAVSAGLALIVGSCSGDDSKDVRPDGSPTTSVSVSNPEASASPSADASSGSQGSLSWESETSIDLPYPEVNHVQILGDHVVFAYGRSPGQLNSVGVLDWRTGETRTLYESSYPKGHIDWAEIVDDTVMFVDQEGTPTLGVEDPMRWRLLAVPLDATEALEVDNSGPKGTIFEQTPFPLAGPASFIWVEWEDVSDPFAGRRVREWKPGWEQPRDLLRDRLVGRLRLGSAGLVWMEAIDRQLGGTSGQDLFLLAAGDTEPQRLTTRGLVVDFQVHDDQIIWTERPDPKADNTNRVDPNAIYVARIAASDEARRLFDGFNGGNPVIGEGFAAWWTATNKLVLADTATSDATTLRGFRPSISARHDIDESHVVLAESKDAGAGVSTTIHVLGVSTAQ